MGQHFEKAPASTVGKSQIDGGPLSDEELEGALRTFDRLRQTKDVLDASAFVALFGADLGESFGVALHKRVARGGPILEVDAQRFIDFVATTLRGSNSKRAEAFVCCACGVEDVVDTSGSARRVEKEFVEKAVRSFWVVATGGTSSPPSVNNASPLDAGAFVESAVAHARADVDSGLEEDTPTGGLMIPVASIARWSSRHCGYLGDAWAAFARPRLLDQDPSTIGSSLPRLGRTSHVLDDLAESQRNATLLALALHMGAISGTTPDWRRLYSSGDDGFSFYRVTHGIVGYDGPTVVLVRSRDGDVFGGFMDTPWRESTEFYGGSECCVFGLQPRVAICRARLSSQREFAYLNLRGATRIRGMQLGGSGPQGGARIYVPEQLGDATIEAHASCLTFEAAALAPSAQDVSHVEVGAIEVWGVGAADALSKRDAAQRDRAAFIDKARKVDKAKFVDSDFDKEHFLGKTFGAKSR